jgi:FemAB-related protein (PEP-CTERM system-associated)
MVSMPYFNYGGAIADEEFIEDMLMQAANEHAATLGVSHIEYRDDIPRKGLPVRANKVNMILPLPRDEETLWAGFSSKLRSQIRRPQRVTLETLCGGEDHLDDFYSVFSRNMRDLGTPVYAKEFFRNILHSFPRESRILVVRMKNRPVAAGFLIGHRDRLEIPWASSAREVNHLGVNMFFYWKVLQYAIDKHYRSFDFGRSSTGSGTYRFKEQWGAQPKQLYWHYHLNEDRELPSLNPDNPKYSLAINIWKRLPLILTNRLGPLIVRNLP